MQWTQVSAKGNSILGDLRDLLDTHSVLVGDTDTMDVFTCGEVQSKLVQNVRVRLCGLTLALGA